MSHPIQLMTGTPGGIKSAPPSGGLGRRLAPWIFRAAALFVSLWLLGCAWGWDQALRRSASLYAIQNAPPELTISPRHFLDADALYWLAYARDMADSGTWRIRWTHLDNSPVGRPVHWSQPMIWLLLAAGQIRSLGTGEPLSTSIESAALWVQPALLLAFTLATAWFIRRRWGLSPALLWMALVPASKALFWAFHPFRPDHQALQIMLAFGNLFFLTLGGLGWTRAQPAPSRRLPSFCGFQADCGPSASTARVWFAAAGLISGMALWVGATVSMFCTGAILAAWVSLLFLAPRGRLPHDQFVFHPGLWKIWGYVAGTTALAFYLLEYLPHPLAMRLEVNHPLYALAWMGAGETLARLGEWRAGKQPLSRTRLLGLLLALAPIAALFLAFWQGPDAWHALRHVGMRRLHAFISEFQATPFFSGPFAMRWLDEAGLVLLFFPLALFLLASRRIRWTEWYSLGLALLSAAAFLLLASWQNRWSAFCALFILWLAIAALPVGWRLARKSPALRRAFGAFLLLLAAQSAYAAFVHLEYLGLLRDGGAIQPLLTAAIQRDFAAQALARDPHHAQWRVISSDPSLTPTLAYHAGIPGLASYYWENVPGLESATAFFTDSADGPRARQLARDHGFTHLLVSGPDKMAHDYDYILRGRYDEAAISRSLGGGLRDRPNSPPVWLVPAPGFEWLPRVAFTFRGYALPADELRLYQLRPD